MELNQGAQVYLSPSCLHYCGLQIKLYGTSGTPSGIEAKSDHVSPLGLQSWVSFQICCFLPQFPTDKNYTSLSQREALRTNV